MKISFFQDQILSHAARRIRAESYLPHIQAGRRQFSIFAVRTVKTGQRALSYHFIPRRNGRNRASNRYCLACPLMPWRIRRNIITSLRGFPLKALYIRLADAAGAQFDQDLIRQQFGKFHLLYS